MEEETKLVLDDGDREIVDLLVDLGLSRNPAKAVVYLAQIDEAISRQVEEGADMRQPEVSQTMRELRRRGWVAKRDVPREGKGRPLHSYRLDVTFEAILDEIEATIRRRAERDLDRIEQLREMAPGA